MLQDNLEVWDRGGGSEVQEGGDICMLMADSPCRKTETNTTL